MDRAANGEYIKLRKGDTMKSVRHLVIAMAILLAGCAQQSIMGAGEASVALNGLLDRFMVRAERENPHAAMLSGKKPKGMPDFSYAAAEETAAFAESMLAEVNAIPEGKLTHQERLTLAMLKRALGLQREALKHYWLSFDATPYQAGLAFSQLPKLLHAFDLSDSSDREDYLVFVAGIGGVLADYREKLAGQRERGILLPRSAIDGTVGLYQGLSQTLPLTVVPAEKRLKTLSPPQALAFQQQAEDVYQEKILPALDALIAIFDVTYRAAAPERVGMSQYPGGREAYQYFISRETTRDLTPEEIHQRGLDYMAELRAEKAEIRKELGFTGGELAFKKKLLADDRFYAETPAEVENRYQRYIDMIKPKLGDYFMLTPEASYGVKRLNPAAEATVTFGYYSAPSAGQSEGYYYYNGSQLDQRNMIWTQALIYHELVPGHHFHMALQQENDKLPAFRKHGTYITAFNEGWANYAASLADEMGIMTDPYDRYGWLLFDSFITARLVVDTGMNALGWTLQEARDYMYENTFESKTQIDSETIRYSTSIPAQSLAYKLGMEKIWDIRRAMEQTLSDNFNIKAFHAAIVGSGALPMPLLERHVAYELLK